MQSRARIVSDPPPLLDDALSLTLFSYPISRLPSWVPAFESGDCGPLTRYIEHLFNHAVVPDSHPGFIYCRFGQSNEEVLSKTAQRVAELVIARLYLLGQTDIESCKSGLSFVEQNLSDPVRVFIKNEPHKVAKLREGRLRLIFSVSLVDNVLQRCLFTEQDETEISSWPASPSMPGLGFTKQQVAKTIERMREIKNPTSSDVGAWDFTVQLWELLADADRRAYLARPYSKYFHRLLRNQAHIMAHSLILTSDGVAYEQTLPGMMKSGAKNTSSTNSYIRVLAHNLVALQANVVPAIIAMGDDAIETFVPDAHKLYADLGHVLKMHVKIDREAEFCGHLYNLENFSLQPLNAIKQTVKLLWNRSPNFDQSLAYRQKLGSVSTRRAGAVLICHQAGLSSQPRAPATG